jgi:hypothetical protein
MEACSTANWRWAVSATTPPRGPAHSGLLHAATSADRMPRPTPAMLAAPLTQIGTLQTAPILIAVGTASLIIAGLRSFIGERVPPAAARANEPG